MDFPAHPFWDFSVSVHSRPGVPEACLALQRGYGLDVNLLFFYCWAAVQEGRPLSRERVTQAADKVTGWQEEVVRPVWKARWRLKGGFGSFPPEQAEALRKTLIAAELDAERMEQLCLAEAVPVSARREADDGMRLAAAAANLADYLRTPISDGKAPPGDPPPDDLIQALSALVAGVFPGLDADRIRDELIRALKERGPASR